MVIGIIVNNVLRDNVNQIKDLYTRYELGTPPADDVVIDPYDLAKYFPIEEEVEEDVIDFDPSVNELDFGGDDFSEEPLESSKTIYEIIYNEGAFEVFARAQETIPGIIKKFSDIRASNPDIQMYAMNIESPQSKQATLTFLGTKNFAMDGVIFPERYSDVWDHCDLLITDHPDILAEKPSDKKCIKLNCASNTEYQTEWAVDTVEEILKLDIIKDLNKS